MEKTCKSISDLARLANVSEQTALRVINQSPLVSSKAYDKVRSAIEKSGFAPEPHDCEVELRRNSLIVLAFSGSHSTEVCQVEAGILSALEGTSFAMALQPFDADSKDLLLRYRNFLDIYRPSGILIMSPLSVDDRLAGLAWEFGSRCMRLTDRTPNGHGISWVVCSEQEATENAIHHLAKLGHRRIGFISRSNGITRPDMRELGYLEALADLNLYRGPFLIAAGDGGWESGREAAKLLLQVSPAPSAILACTEEMAAGAMLAATERGISIPDQLSIFGIGGGQQTTPPMAGLTTVRLPLEAMAHDAVQLMISERYGALSPLIFSPEIVNRGSIGPCPCSPNVDN